MKYHSVDKNPLSPAYGWTVLPLSRLERLPGDLYLELLELPARHAFEARQYPWGHLIHATKGTLRVVVDNTWYVLTPEHMLWVPPGLNRQTASVSGARFCRVYVSSSAFRDLPASVRLLQVPPLIKVLIEEIDQAQKREETSEYLGLLSRVLTAAVARARVHHVRMKWPKSAVLQRICEALYWNPAQTSLQADCARKAHMSSSTFARRFEHELGMSFRIWYQQMRLFRATEWLSEGRNITDVALDLGYSSPSAFTYMFRTETGLTPARFRASKVSN